MKPAVFALVLLLGAVAPAPVAGKSKHVYVFQLDRKYWDVRPGDTLSGIAAALLPHSPGKQGPLMRAIVELNPDAFIGGKIDRLRAGIRLWLPGGIETYAEPPLTGGKVRHYDWGSIRQPD